MAEHRGRLIHYSMGIGYTRILATEFTWHIGTDEEPDYDREVTLGLELRILGAQVLSALQTHGPMCRMLWPPVPSSLYGAFQRGWRRRTWRCCRRIRAR